jgi:transcriptional regulator with XRE-family HTH domain
MEGDDPVGWVERSGTQRSPRPSAVVSGSGSASTQPTAPEADALGPQIRDLRRERGLTLAQLAEAAGLSIGHLSQVERGLSTPTIRQLQAVSTALGVRIGWFFRPLEPAASPPDPGAVVVRAGARKRLRYDGLGMTDFLLTPGLEGRLELLLCTLEPGAGSGEEPYSHEGEEAGLVLEGALELWVEEERHLLVRGDSFAFASTRPHRYRNPGEVATTVVWAITPPSY